MRIWVFQQTQFNFTNPVRMANLTSSVRECMFNLFMIRSR